MRVLCAVTSREIPVQSYSSESLAWFLLRKTYGTTAVNKIYEINYFLDTKSNSQLLALVSLVLEIKF